MVFLVVTGISGAGKTEVTNALEDIGFYCVDNIPSELILNFYNLCEKTTFKSTERVAVVSDIRTSKVFDTLFEALEVLKMEQKNYKVLFIDANDDIIVRRFKKSRRKHPLSEDYLGSLVGAIRVERNLLSSIREKAQVIIDTSFLSVSDLKDTISNLFLDNTTESMLIRCISFGFKYGIPIEADLVFDVRCLPNPYYIKNLKRFTGLDACVRDYVLKWEITKIFFKKVISFLDYTVPLYRNEGKSQLVIAVGCTGGKHRSVVLTQLLEKHLKIKNKKTRIHHRDLNR
ncbi:MAG: RNase adapter RapZ [Oscillospiraceae bacterium]|jgi:UPF0042 nucleotide-binding protein|nr:RNase adapter RapZ [Oscillospiraceae bacterium]